MQSSPFMSEKSVGAKLDDIETILASLKLEDNAKSDEVEKS